MGPEFATLAAWAAGAMMKQCPKCGQTFEDSVRFCPADGGVLAEAAAPAEPEKGKRSTNPGMGTVRDPVEEAQQKPDSLASWGIEPSGPIVTTADAVASGTVSGSGRVRVALPGPSPTFAPAGFVPVAEGSAQVAGLRLVEIGGPAPAPAPAPPPAQPFPQIAAPLGAGPAGVVPQALQPSVAQPFPQVLAPPPAAPAVFPGYPAPAPPVMAPPAGPPPVFAGPPAPPPAYAAPPAPAPPAGFVAAAAPTAEDSLEYQIPKRGGKTGLIIAAVVIVVLGGLGGGLYYFLARGASSLVAALADAAPAAAAKVDAGSVAAAPADRSPADAAVAIIPVPELEKVEPPKPAAAPEPKAKPEPKARPEPKPVAKAPDKPKPEPKAVAKAPDKPKPEPKGKGRKKKLDSSTVLDPFK